MPIDVSPKDVEWLCEIALRGLRVMEERAGERLGDSVALFLDRAADESWSDMRARVKRIRKRVVQGVG